MTDVLEDTLVFLDVDLDDTPRCVTDAHPANPPRATHLGMIPCQCNALMCTPCAVLWQAFLLSQSPETGVDCGKCGAKCRVADVRIVPLS